MAAPPLAELAARPWDVIVIGTGMGGGLAGRRLAEAGLEVLFVEKGPEGWPAEAQGLSSRLSAPDARLLRGYWPQPITARIDGAESRFFGPVGCGVGGSSVFYAAALERPARHDLDEVPGLPHPTGGWPVGWDAFHPWFDEAARLLCLTGTADPLSADPPPPLAAPIPATPGDIATMEGLAGAGLHPYRLNLAVARPAECRGCFGHKCPHDCKMDGRSAGVRPALATGNATLLTEAEVVELVDQDGRVTGAVVRQGGATATLTARTYLLAAGALGSPRLLLGSRRNRPEGLANSSGLVGRGLMFHLNEIFALWPRRKMPAGSIAAKSVALRDLYGTTDRFGMVQSMGVEARYGEVLEHLRRLYDRSPLRRWRRLRKLLSLPAALAVRMTGNAALYVGFLEDMPLPENRVVLDAADPGALAFEYRLPPELLARRRRFRRALSRAFRGHRKLFVGGAPAPNYGHPAGTLRFGADPATSVLTPECRSHDLANLYVADASFMPTALGVNPSFTIAANALRVADIIVRSHGARP